MPENQKFIVYTQVGRREEDAAICPSPICLSENVPYNLHM
jgi:hypothetical protein